MCFPMPRLGYNVNIKVEKVDAYSPDTGVLKQAARLIARGGVVVCPTDTGYAFSASALDTKAVARVYNLKGRSYSNPIHIAVSSIEEAGKYAHVDEAARLLAERFLPGALTLVMPRREIIPNMLVAGRDTVGIRIPDNAVMLNLVKTAELPLTTTSANISGRPTPYSVEEVLKQLEEAGKDVMLILDQGPLSGRELSTIIDISVRPPQLIRQGRVSWLEIREVLKKLPEPDGTL
jgi:L-threonylcarbamoyladenylate synthase